MGSERVDVGYYNVDIWYIYSLSYLNFFFKDLEIIYRYLLVVKDIYIYNFKVILRIVRLGFCKVI